MCITRAVEMAYVCITREAEMAYVCITREVEMAYVCITREVDMAYVCITREVEMAYVCLTREVEMVYVCITPEVEMAAGSSSQGMTGGEDDPNNREGLTDKNVSEQIHETVLRICTWKFTSGREIEGIVVVTWSQS